MSQKDMYTAEERKKKRGKEKKITDVTMSPQPSMNMPTSQPHIRSGAEHWYQGTAALGPGPRSYFFYTTDDLQSIQT